MRTKEYYYSVQPVCRRKCLLNLDFANFHAVLRYKVMQLCLCAVWGQNCWGNATLSPWKSFLSARDNSKHWTDFPSVCCSCVLPTFLYTILFM